MSSYVFEGGDEPQTFDLLPEGDYQFQVLEFSEPYQKADGKWIAKVKVKILPRGDHIYTYPWSGEDRNGKKRDGIGQFLKAINNAPKKGETPDWDEIVGLSGRCHVRIKPARDPYPESNEVGWFLVPKPLDLQPENRMQFQKPAEPSPNLNDDEEPEDIPF